jgi:parvulin-like peptidyl-prolyl isomerase
MSLILEPKRWSKPITSVLIAFLTVTSVVTATAGPPTQAIPTAVFATDTNAGANAERAVPGAAAVVDAHIVSMDDVILTCLRKYRSYVIDQIVQGYVIDRECKRRGITVSESEIDKQVEDLRKNLAPSTLDETLEKHHMTIVEVRDKFRQDIERTMLAADQVKPVRMIHCREIFIKYGLGGTAGPGTNRSEAEALALAKGIEEQVKEGKDFGNLVTRYSDGEGAGGKGDMGVLYGHMLGWGTPLLDAAMALHKGELSPPVKTGDGYHLIQAVSMDGDHPETEDSLYKDADKASRHLQIQFLEPKIVVELINNSQITFVDDAELAAGKPIPDAAAIIDGHAISMKEVAAKCLADYGPKTTDILVQNYLVDRECARRGIKVSEAEIDRQIAQLRKQIAPSAFDEGLKMHHTTMDGLKHDFRQQIERTKLVIDQVKPTRFVHARVIFVAANPSGSESAPGMKRTDVQAKALIMTIQDQIKAGNSFAETAKQHSETSGAAEDGDIGVLYEGKQGTDTAILNTALAMSKGEISPNPVKTYNGYFLLQAISTSNNHASDEDAAYAEALAIYQEQKAQSLIPAAIVDLIKKSTVVYFVHS